MIYRKVVKLINYNSRKLFRCKHESDIVGLSRSEQLLNYLYHTLSESLIIQSILKNKNIYVKKLVNSNGIVASEQKKDIRREGAKLLGFFA